MVVQLMMSTAFFIGAWQIRQAENPPWKRAAMQVL